MKFSGLFYFVVICLLFAIHAPQAFSAPTTLRKGPYLIYAGVNTEMRILWQTDAASVDTVRWGENRAAATGFGASREYNDDHQHIFAVSGLKPGMKYYYEVHSGGTTCAGSFRTAPDTNADHVKFFAYGDTRSFPLVHDHIAHLVDSAFAADSDYQTLILQSGDIVLNGDKDSLWQTDFFSPKLGNLQDMIQNLPFQATMGNHERKGILFQKYFPYPFVADRYWSFDYGPAHFCAIDQFVKYDSGSAQLQWLAKDLQDTKKPWKILFFHQPGWSAGMKDSSHENDLNVQRFIEPLCEKYGVHLVICGHNHFYSRARVMTASGDSVIHITSGGGGAPLYGLDPHAPNILAARKVHHFCEVEIVSSALLRMRVISEDEEVIDSFSIDRSH